MTRRHRLAGRATLAAVLLAVFAALGGSTAGTSSAAPYCGLVWGSVAEYGPGGGAVAPGPDGLLGIRAGEHECYDRLVVDLSFPSVDYSVRYVPTVVEDPTGDAVPVAGEARLHITVSGAPAGWNETPRALAMPNVAGYRTLRQVAFAGSFEQVTSFGLGVRASLPFRVLVLAGPAGGSRLVIDVAHRW